MLVVDHKDGNKKNNKYTNLEWVTSAENTRRAEEMGIRDVKGSANGNSKYTEEFIHDICRLFEAGKSNNEIYCLLRNQKRCSDGDKEDFAFYQFLYKLRKRLIWTHISSQYFTPDIRTRKTHKIDDTKIIEMINKGCSKQEIFVANGVANKKDDPLLYRAVKRRIDKYTNITNNVITASSVNMIN